MNIIFVRHGHPDYKNDCLTELGHLHAKAAAQRLKDEKVDEIYSSSCGRAYETACHIAQLHKMDIIKLDFMREIKWGKHPWKLARELVNKNYDIMNKNWADTEDYRDDAVVMSFAEVSKSFDEWLQGFGLIREGEYYRVDKECDKTVMLVSHGGSSTVVLAHVLNMPFPFICRAIMPDFTAVTKLCFKGDVGELIAPTFEIVNDSRHIEGITLDGVF